MHKLITVASLFLALLVEPALAHAATIPARANGAQKEKPTSVSGSDASCKKYFALIDEVVSVPCARNAMK